MAIVPPELPSISVQPSCFSSLVRVKWLLVVRYAGTFSRTDRILRRLHTRTIQMLINQF